MQNHDKVLSNDEIDNASSDDFHDDTQVISNDKQTSQFLRAQSTEAKDLIDNGFESFVQKDSYNQIVNLILKQ